MKDVKDLKKSLLTYYTRRLKDLLANKESVSQLEQSVTQLQNSTHTHSNKTVLDGVTSGKVSNWNTAYTQRHTHTNKTVLDNITSEKVAEWDTIASKPGLKTEEGGEIFCDYENNKATGTHSASFGELNTVSGNSSFSIGHQNTVSGNASFSAGSFNTVNGLGAMALGQYLISSSDNQIVIGKNNVEDTSNKYVFIVGNGDNPGSGRHNAFAIDWSGNIYVNGSTSGVNVQELATAVSNSSAARNIYINAETGDDYSNTGLSVSSPFQTIKKALLYAQYCNKAIFNLSPGEYTIPAELYMFSNIYRRFQGTTPNDTIIKTSGIVSDSSRLFFENLTLTAEPESNNVLKAQYRGSASFKNCVINTSHYFCAYATSFSDISVVDTTLNGAHGYALSAIDGSNMRVNNCTDNTGKGIRVGATSVAHICDTSENPIKYTINNYGMVYLNGQQVAPTPTSDAAILSMGGNI